MSKEEELWLKLYEYINNSNRHVTMETINNWCHSISIKLKQTYIVSNWCSGEDELETRYIVSEGNSFIECLEDVVSKLKEDDWNY